MAEKKNQKDNLPEPQSAKKANNKIGIEFLIIVVLLWINILFDGGLSDIAGIACIVLAAVSLVKFFKNKKK